MFVYLCCIQFEGEVHLLATISTSLGYHRKLEIRNGILRKEDIIRAFKWLRNNLTMSERLTRHGINHWLVES